MLFNNKFLEILPEELVNMIADYHDYHKHCKPKHKIQFNMVMNDIITISKVMNPISPKIVKGCWGFSSTITVYDDNMWQTDNWLGMDADTLGHNFMYDNVSEDDEENNYGMNYDDTHYPYSDDENNYGMVGLYEED